MPIFMIFLGLVLVMAAARGQEQKLIDILRDDFTGDNNFAAWLAVLVILGVIAAAWKDSEPLANAAMVLVFVSLLISQRGFWERFKEQVLQ